MKPESAEPKPSPVIPSPANKPKDVPCEAAAPSLDEPKTASVVDSIERNVPINDEVSKFQATPKRAIDDLIDVNIVTEDGKIKSHNNSNGNGNSLVQNSHHDLISQPEQPRRRRQHPPTEAAASRTTPQPLSQISNATKKSQSKDDDNKK